MVNPIRREKARAPERSLKSVAVGGHASSGGNDTWSSTTTSAGATESSNEVEQQVRAGIGDDPMEEETGSKRVAEDNTGMRVLREEITI